MVAQGHGGEVQVVHPLGDHVALGKVGLRASLPHISRGEKEDVVLVVIGVLEVGGQLIYAHLSVGIAELAVEVVDGEEIQHDDHRDTAIVALAVVILVGVILLGGQLGVLGIQDALGGLIRSRGGLGVRDSTYGGLGACVGGCIGIRDRCVAVGISRVTDIGEYGSAHIGVHARGRDLGEHMGAGCQKQGQNQKKGE